MQRTGSREGQRIAKLLARAGVGSRRDIERMIEERRVAIDGMPVETPATLLASLHGVTVDGAPVKAPAPARLFLFHKPPGVLTAARDPKGRRTIYDALPKGLPRLMPVGRLDLNTEGLLLLTTDGELKRQLELPSTGVERAYRARAYGQVSQPRLEELIEGVEIDGVRYGQIDANIERRTGANVWIEMVLTEGKNREVRRVLEHLGLQVSRLIRTRYGPFVLADLPVGAIGEVRQADLIAFRQSLGKGSRPDRAIAVRGIDEAARPRATAPDTGTKRPAAARTRPPKPGRPSRQGAEPPAPKSRSEPRRPPPAQGGTRPDRSDEAANASPSTRSARPPKRKAGWAKPKPKPGPGGRPRGK